MELNGTEFGKLINVSRQAVSLAFKEGRLFKNDNGKFDPENKINKSYIMSKKNSVIPVFKEAEKVIAEKVKHDVKSDKKPKKIKSSPKNIVTVESEKKSKNDIKTENYNTISNKVQKFIDNSEMTSGEEVEKLLNMKFKDVLQYYGTNKKIKDHVDVLYKISQIEKNHIASDAMRSELVELNLVRKKVFAFLDLMANQLLDYPQSMIEIEISMMKSDESKSKFEIPRMHEKNIEKIIRECKKVITREFKNILKEKKEDE